MTKIKQLLMINEVNELIYSSILCFKEENKHCFLTKNSDFIKSFFGMNFIPEERQVFDILNKKIIDFYPESFDGRVYVVSSFGGLDNDYSNLKIDFQKEFVYFPEKDSKVQLMTIVENSEFPCVFNVYYEGRVKIVVTNSNGYDSDGRFLIHNKNILKEVEGYVLLSEERGPISYSKKFSNEYLSFAEYSDIGLTENDNKVIFPTVIYLNDDKLIDIQVLNNLGVEND